MKAFMGANVGVMVKKTHKNTSDARIERLLEKKKLKKKGKHDNTSK